MHHRNESMYMYRQLITEPNIHETIDPSSSSHVVVCTLKRRWTGGGGGGGVTGLDVGVCRHLISATHTHMPSMVTSC